MTVLLDFIVRGADQRTGSASRSRERLARLLRFKQPDRVQFRGFPAFGKHFRIAFFRVHHGQCCAIYDVFHFSPALQHIRRFAEAHEYGPDGLGAAYPHQQFICDVG